VEITKGGGRKSGSGPLVRKGDKVESSVGERACGGWGTEGGSEGKRKAQKTLDTGTGNIMAQVYWLGALAFKGK